MNVENSPAFARIDSVAERRAHARFAVEVQVELRQEGNDVPFRLQTSDLSRGGCYVQLMMTQPVGTYLNATLWLNDLPLRVKTCVMTRHPHFGNGLAFIEFQDDGERLLERYLQAIAAQRSCESA
jgi:hypothetical protein